MDASRGGKNLIPHYVIFTSYCVITMSHSVTTISHYVIRMSQCYNYVFTISFNALEITYDIVTISKGSESRNISLSEVGKNLSIVNNHHQFVKILVKFVSRSFSYCKLIRKK